MWTLLGVSLLCVAWIAVLFLLVLPVAALVLGLGIDVPRCWARYGKTLRVYSHPRFSLFVGLGVLAVLGWAAWHLARR
jgi:hypothetical protein